MTNEKGKDRQQQRHTKRKTTQGENTKGEKEWNNKKGTPKERRKRQTRPEPRKKKQWNPRTPGENHTPSPHDCNGTHTRKRAWRKMKTAEWRTRPGRKGKGNIKRGEHPEAKEDIGRGKMEEERTKKKDPKCGIHTHGMDRQSKTHTWWKDWDTKGGTRTQNNRRETEHTLYVRKSYINTG
ncbi:hypothetical protein JTB14_038078 [Gonioctena quinquepunctata]|nr:hypothetical protein JTB14_038078 [Gonioctena quinquepunctata]